MTYFAMDPYWSYPTLFLYIGTMLLCGGIAMYCRKSSLAAGPRFDAYAINQGVFLVFLLLLFMKGFGTTGRDIRTGYYMNYRSAESMSSFHDKSVEFGYRLLNVLCYNLGFSYQAFLFTVSLITLLPVMVIINKYRHRIEISSAVLMYVGIFYYAGLSPIRIAVASSFGLIAFDAMVEQKPLKAFLWIILASQFHVTAIALFAPLAILAVKKLRTKTIILSSALVLLLVYLGRNQLMSFLMSANERYTIYSAFEDVSVGMQKFIYYIPLFFVVFAGDESKGKSYFFKIAIIYLTMLFCFDFMEYFISILGRFRDMFLPIIIIIPYYLKNMKIKFPRYRGLITLCTVAYCILRVVFLCVDYYIGYDIMPYTNVFGWII